jgi:hypothetical protein
MRQVYCVSAKLLWKFIIVGLVACATRPGRLEGAPYASNVSFQTPTTVSFTLNEPADSLFVRINGGAPMSLDGSTKGLKTFSLNSASDTFAITATKNDPIGFTIPTGATIPSVANGLGQPTAGSGYNPISNDADNLVKFNSPRGVTVANDPTNPQFGTTYISNSAAGTTGGRTLGDGLYALRADQSDAFGFGNTAQVTGFEGTASSSSPFRLQAASDRNVYIADFSDANGGVFRMSGTLTNPTRVLAGVGGPSTLPAGQNHGSTTAVYVSGSAGGNLTLHTVDEDLTSSQFGGLSTTDKNSVWRYDIGTSALPYAGTPTKVNTSQVLVPLATSDMEIGTNGKIYLGQNRAAGNEPGIVVLNADGTTAFDSLTASRTLLSDPVAADIFRNIQGITVSLDGRYLAAVLNISDVVVVPLDANGIPDIANRLLVDTPNDIISGRDIAFDAADNIHYVSSGQALYRVLAPGGLTTATTSWNGSSFSFVAVPEPSAALLFATATSLIACTRRRGTLFR